VLALDGGRELRGDRLLVAAGRRPRVSGLGLVTVHMVPDARGIPVDARLRAGARLWAIGAVTGVAGAGEYQAGIVAANLLGDAREADYAVLPRVIATDPQAAAVGAAEDRFAATVPAESGGYLTLLSDGERLTGGHAVGREAGDWLRRAAHAIRLGVPLEAVQPSTAVELAAFGALRREVAAAARVAG
jgi:dihydrolipoamide dehydrogenase